MLLFTDRISVSKSSKIAALACSIACLTTALLALRNIRKPRYTRRPRKRSRRPAKYRRAALLRPVLSDRSTPWNRILSCGVDDDFLISTNFTKDIVINNLLPLFEVQRANVNFGSPFRMGPKSRGRKPLLRSIDLLGLVLWYLKVRNTIYSLCPIFGVTDSTVGVWLDYGLEVLKRVVVQKEEKDYEIRWPSYEEMKASAALLENNRINGLLLTGVFAVTDGGRMPCADYTDCNLQNAYFEGFTQAVEATNLFVFNFFGELIHAAINYPGSWHDTKLAMVSGLYFPKLSDEMTPPGMAILGDSAFVNNTSVTNGKIVRGRKANETSDIPVSAELGAVDIILQRIMPSERQSAEWGVRAIKAPFSRLQVPLPADAKKRERLITICCHLFNYRTRLVGLNQIRTTYSRSQQQ